MVNDSQPTATDAPAPVTAAPSTPAAPPAAARRKAVARKAPAKKTATRAAKTPAKPKAAATKPKAPAAPLKAPTATAKVSTPKPAAATAADAPPAKEKKPKLVRDGFTIPKAEYVVLGELKLRAAGLQFPVKKSELVRAGIKALAAMSGPAFLAALKAVPAIKTGRPNKD